MKKILLPLLAILFLTACEKESSSELITDETSYEATYENGSASERNPNKRDVCHNGKIKSVSINAIPAHQGHGDAVDMDQDGFFDIDNPCSETDCDDTTYDPTNSCGCVEDEIPITIDPDGTPENGDEFTIYVHPTDNDDNIQWGQLQNDIIGLTNIPSFPGSIVDFEGVSNTAAIVAHLGNWNGGDYAANRCATLSTETGCDWYLPAAGELNAIYQQLGPNGNNEMPGGYYWSSTEGNSNHGWIHIFNAVGNRGFFDKSNGGDEVRCRCVRR